MPRSDWVLALFLGAVAVATRAPFRARLLPTWDAVQFALALGEYDIAKHQPHPPGYILYVTVARALAAVVRDPVLVLPALAIGASAATVVLVYCLAWRLYRRPTAVVAAAVLVASPLFWFVAAAGLSYAVEAALATAVALSAWALRTGRPRALVWSSVTLGLAAGVRQSILVVLFPLWLGMAWAAARRWRPVLGGVALVALVSATWLVPMVALTGGLGRYLGATLALYESTVRATTILGGPGQWRANVLGLSEAFVLGLSEYDDLSAQLGGDRAPAPPDGSSPRGSCPRSACTPSSTSATTAISSRSCRRARSSWAGDSSGRGRGSWPRACRRSGGGRSRPS